MAETKILFKSFSSGSCGNCYYLGVETDGMVTSGILIDGGVSLRRIKRELGAHSLDLDDFQSVLVTHDHMDHIRSLGSYSKHLQKPVWTTKDIHSALSHHVLTYEYVPSCRKVLDEGWNEVAEGISANYFPVPHDATQTVGYAIRFPGHNYVHITDCGKMTAEAIDFCSKADTVVIESNYDRDMLINGPYPADLKKRILSGSGHMSNDACCEAIKAFWHEGLRNIFLCHLSENNNTPEAARSAAAQTLASLGAEGVRLETLPRQTPSQLIYL